MSEIKTILLRLIGQIEILNEQLQYQLNVKKDFPFITLEEASRISGLSRKTLKNYFSKGILTRYGSKRKPLIAKEEFLEQIKHGFKSPIPQPQNKKIKPIRLKEKFLKKRQTVVKKHS